MSKSTKVIYTFMIFAKVRPVKKESNRHTQTHTDTHARTHVHTHKHTYEKAHSYRRNLAYLPKNQTFIILPSPQRCLDSPTDAVSLSLPLSATRTSGYCFCWQLAAEAHKTAAGIWPFGRMLIRRKSLSALQYGVNEP